MRNYEPIIAGLPACEPLIIAGPCSAESEHQLAVTAESLSAMGVKVLRAGLWKPRTRPGGFEGVGVAGLPWLVDAAHKHNMAAATEVGCAAHVNAALGAGVDILWIGARTSANPFAVQEIADALRDSGKSPGVLVKNPVNPDIELWIGALQRIINAGVKRLAAVHRGFSRYNPGIYRNPPQWAIPIELHRRMPGLPIFFDPSHAGGKRELVGTLSQQALDIGFDGLMIEVHPSPDNALSDARQQITPVEMNRLLRELTVRQRHAEESELQSLRSEIDECDRELIETLAARMDVSRRIGEYKKARNLSVLQTERHDSVMKSRVEAGVKAGLSEEFMAKIMSAVHAESVRHQVNVLDGGSGISPTYLP